MADEPALPQLPSGIETSKRVRLHRSSSPVVSSDSPQFSSDDDPSAENYSGSRGRLKRRFRGPWYSQRPVDIVVPGNGERIKVPRKFQRNFDSAIFMGSDHTEGDEDADFSSNVQELSFASGSQQSFSMRSHTPLRPGIQLDPTPEELAEKHIQQCMDNLQEDIDLSDRGLRNLPTHTLLQLRYYMALHPATTTFSPDTHQTLDPKLNLYLYSNSLTRVPWEICNLSNLTVLSLRNNKLFELPSGIERLQKLIALNVSNNNLRYLPFEIIHLLNNYGSLQGLNLHPNPFYEPDETDLVRSDQHRLPDQFQQREATVTQTNRRWALSYKYRSLVRFFSNDGKLIKGPKFPEDDSLFTSPHKAMFSSPPTHGKDTKSIRVAPLDDIPEPPRSFRPVSKAFSLRELTVQHWSSSPGMPDLTSYLGYEPPPQLSRLLDDAVTLREQEGGERKCTICRRVFVIPQSEWIEWWEIKKAQAGKGMASAASPLRSMENKRDEVEKKVPLMRRGCSWLCVPKNDVVGSS